MTNAVSDGRATVIPMVDPEYRDLIDVLPKFDFTSRPIDEIRAELAAAMPPGDPDPEVDETEVYIPHPGTGGRIKLLVYKPLGKAGVPVLIHFHPGGHVLGSAAMSAQSNRERARKLGCAVVSVDYSLAPEAPFPTALEQAYAALEWLHRDGLGGVIDRSRIVLVGESAGAGLAASLALLARDRGGPAVLFQLLIYPMLDDRTVAREDAEPTPHVGEFIWTRANNQYAWASFLGGDAASELKDYAVPARAATLKDLPPAFIAVGSLDLFVQEDLEYASRLIRAGVSTEMHVYPGAFHGFDLVPGTRLTKLLQDDCEAALRRAFEVRSGRITATDMSTGEQQ